MLANELLGDGKSYADGISVLLRITDTSNLSKVHWADVMVRAARHMEPQLLKWCEHIAASEHGSRALVHACKNELASVAMKLIDLGCGRDFVDVHGGTALYYACRNNMSEVVLQLRLLDCEGGATIEAGVLNMACETNMSKVALRLLELGREPSNDALLWAIRNKMNKVVQTLMARPQCMPGYVSKAGRCT